MNLELKKIRKELAPFKKSIKERDYSTLNRLLQMEGLYDDRAVNDAMYSLKCADAFKLSAPYRRPQRVMIAGHFLLSTIEIALMNR